MESKYNIKKDATIELKQFKGLTQSKPQYETLLDNLYETMESSLINTNISKLKIPHPKCMRSNRDIYWVNFKKICEIIKRDMDHVQSFIDKELQLKKSSSLNQENHLIMRIRADSKKFESILRSYLIQYVKCNSCGSFQTNMHKDRETRTFRIDCIKCSCQRHVVE